MARARLAKHPKPVEPEEESQEVEEQEEATAEPEPAPTMSKAAAAKAALEAGIDSPKDAVEFALKKFGVEIKGADFSAVKSRYKTKDAPTTGKRGRPASTTSKAPAPAKAVAAPQNGSADILEGLQTLKNLISQHGVDQVRKMVDVLE